VTKYSLQLDQVKIKYERLEKNLPNWGKLNLKNGFVGDRTFLSIEGN
jgi:hypothetical protein